MWVQPPKLAEVNILPPKLIQPAFGIPSGACARGVDQLHQLEQPKVYHPRQSMLDGQRQGDSRRRGQCWCRQRYGRLSMLALLASVDVGVNSHGRERLEQLSTA